MLEHWQVWAPGFLTYVTYVKYIIQSEIVDENKLKCMFL